MYHQRKSWANLLHIVRIKKIYHFVPLKLFMRRNRPRLRIISIIKMTNEQIHIYKKNSSFTVKNCHQDN